MLTNGGKEQMYCIRHLPDLRFCFLTHELEFSKRSNTGQLAATLLPDTIVLEWSRVAPPQALLDILQQADWQSLLVFPGEFAIYHADEHRQLYSCDSQGGVLFIILDATWQQARKIYRQSPYLHTVPLYNISNPSSSIYSLRRNQQQGHLCTAEVVAHILKQEGYTNKSEQLIEAVAAFCDSYSGKKRLIR